jgi:two-component system OmpR family response regulator/two-component system response regulator RstA
MSTGLSIKGSVNKECKCTNDILERSTILFLKSNHKLSNLVLHKLLTHTYNVIEKQYDDSILTIISEDKPTLIIVDIGLNSLPILSIIPKIRAVYSGPLVLLTSQESEKEHITAFNLGVDEYLIKPISENILNVRVNSLVKRFSKKSISDERVQIQCGDLTLYPYAYKCSLKGANIPLTRFEFKLLRLLVDNIGKIMSRDLIYKELLGREYNGSERTVDVRVSQLREKLINNSESQFRVETVWGQGYMLSAMN